MQNTTTQNNKLLFSYPVLWVSLASLASLAVALLILAPIFLLYYRDYISTEVTVWATLGVFVAAVIYDYFLLFLIKRNDRDACHDDDPAPNGGDPGPSHF